MVPRGPGLAHVANRAHEQKHHGDGQDVPRPVVQRAVSRRVDRDPFLVVVVILLLLAVVLPVVRPAGLGRGRRPVRPVVVVGVVVGVPEQGAFVPSREFSEGQLAPLRVELQQGRVDFLHYHVGEKGKRKKGVRDGAIRLRGGAGPCKGRSTGRRWDGSSFTGV